MIVLVSPSASFLNSLAFFLDSFAVGLKERPVYVFHSLESAASYLERSGAKAQAIIVDRHPPFHECERFCQKIRPFAKTVVLLISEGSSVCDPAGQEAGYIVLHQAGKRWIEDLADVTRVGLDA